MAWIPIHDELYEHPKTRKCARALGEPILVTVARLSLFWLWCMKYAKQGDLTSADAFDIEDAAKWTGEPGKFMEALQIAGFTDLFEDSTLLVHDWDKYGGKLIKKQESDLERKKSSTGKTQNSDGIPSPPSTQKNGKSPNSDGIPAEKRQIPPGKTPNSDVREEEKRKEKKREDESTPGASSSNGFYPNPSAQPIDPKEPLTRAVLDALKKTLDFEIGSRSPNDVTAVAKILNKLWQQGHGVGDVELVSDFWPVHLGRPPETVIPMTPAQFLSQFDSLHARALQAKNTPPKRGFVDPEELKKQTAELLAKTNGGQNGDAPG